MIQVHDGTLGISSMLDFDKASVIDAPFPHFSVLEFAHDAFAEEILGWFESDAPWTEHHIRQFYESYDLNFRDIPLPPSLQFLTSAAFARDATREMSKVFATSFKDRVDITAHKLVPPYRIRTHTDFGETAQTHRLLVQLNRGWTAAAGGLLMLLSDNQATEINPNDKFYIPYHRRGICFEISQRSFHAVSPVTDGVRYTFCMSFYSGVSRQA
jgi:hypothetical protein